MYSLMDVINVSSVETFPSIRQEVCATSCMLKYYTIIQPRLGKVGKWKGQAQQRTTASHYVDDNSTSFCGTSHISCFTCSKWYRQLSDNKLPHHQINQHSLTCFKTCFIDFLLPSLTDDEDMLSWTSRRCVLVRIISWTWMAWLST